MKKTIAIIISLLMISTLLSCAGATRQERAAGTGAVVGAGVGAILGQAIGRNTEGTLIGAGLGAMLGGIAGDQIGAYMDRQERELRQAIAASEAESRQRDAAIEAALVERTNDVLTATFRSEVLFDFDSAVLKPGGLTELSRVAGVLNRYPRTRIRVEGHTDATGPEVYNQKLSERRAEAVKAALVSEGVLAERITTVGFGESRPVSSNDDANRRVSIVIEPIRQSVG